MNLSISMTRQGLFMGAGNGLELFATVGGWHQGVPVSLSRNEVGGWRNYRLQLGWFMWDLSIRGGQTTFA